MNLNGGVVVDLVEGVGVCFVGVLVFLGEGGLVGVEVWVDEDADGEAVECCVGVFDWIFGFFGVLGVEVALEVVVSQSDGALGE